MVKNHHFTKSIVDASWNQLVSCTMYSAEEVGRRVVLVDPKNISQQCSTAAKSFGKSWTTHSSLPAGMGSDHNMCIKKEAKRSLL
ncbi:zinc ribbon domain-containing protein [Alicyclobacillus suci]|uniref:zinc ribbon domain-containing protein n=1 Tax=Alicyclobacillus suci TaxID=2816080 RepID=UPI003F6A4818